MRSLNRKAEAGIRGSAPHSRLAQESNISGVISSGSTHTIRMKGKDNRYETYKGSIYQPLKNNGTEYGLRKTQLKESNDRLRALQELDKRREEQLKKEMAALDAKRKVQEEETQKRINIKKVRLAETGYMNSKPLYMPSPDIKGRVERDFNNQNRFLALVQFSAYVIEQEV